MNPDPLRILQQVGELSTTLFGPNSRYYNIETLSIESSDGETVVYLRRRFIPPSGNFQLLQEHMVEEGDRLDNLAAKYLDDPEQFWRLCDANNAMRPDELIETAGRKLRITLPVEIPGGSDV